MNSIEEAENYVRTKMTQKDLDQIDAESNEYKEYYKKREFEIRCNTLYPLTKQQMESTIKTHYHLKKMGFEGF